MEWLRAAILRAGGFEKVAEQTGISVPHLYAVVRRYRRLTPRVVAKLRLALPRVGRARWASILLDSAEESALSDTDNSAAPASKRKATEANPDRAEAVA